MSEAAPQRKANNDVDYKAILEDAKKQMDDLVKQLEDLEKFMPVRITLYKYIYKAIYLSRI